MGSDPVRGSSVFFSLSAFGLSFLTFLPCLLSLVHIHVRDWSCTCTCATYLQHTFCNTCCAGSIPVVHVYMLYYMCTCCITCCSTCVHAVLHAVHLYML